jgi:hypothetical protein
MIPAMQKTILRLLAFTFLATFVMYAQTSSPRNQDSAPTFDIGAIVKETQQMDERNNKLGIFWWIPVEYWEQSAISTGSSPEQARELFAPLREYTGAVVAVGSIGIGNLHWLPEAEVRKNIVLRDQAGNTYKPLDKVSDGAQDLADVMTPVFQKILGPMAEGIHLLFFPAKDASGKAIADPRRNTEFSLVVTDLMGGTPSSYTWKLPLTSLMPPKFCPVGKEKVDANWKYCPWHGNKLDADSTPAPAQAPSKH